MTAVSDAGRDRAEAIAPRAPVLATPDLVERSELVLLAVPDDQLAGLVQAWRTPGSGSRASSSCTPVRTTVSTSCGPPCRPARSRSRSTRDGVHRHEGRPRPLRDAHCAVTAPAPVLPIAQALVVEMGAEPFVVSEQDRPAYADAVRAAVSFSTAIVDQSAGTLSGIGVERPGLVLGALVRSAVDNALAAADGRADH